MDINTQLNENTAAKLAHLQQMTNQDLEEVLQQVIDLYYQQLQTLPKTPMEILQENGFIGCIQAEPDLSTNYKSIVQRVSVERS